MFTCMLVNQHKAVRHTDIRSNNTSKKKGWNLRSKRFVLSRKRSRKTAHTPTWLYILRNIYRFFQTCAKKTFVHEY